MARQKSSRKSMLVDEADHQEQPQDNAPAAPPKGKKSPGMGDNIKGLHGEVKGAYDRIEQLKKDRAEINAKIKAERESMEAKGITKTAFDAAMSYVNMTVEKRDGFDTAYIIAREGLGAPVKGAQADLFNESVDAEGDDDGQG